MPRKEFDAFTRLDASDVNTFLMDQSVMTFGSATARDAAIDTPVEGQVTYLNDIDSLSVYNGTEWVTNRPIMNFAGTAARGSAIPSPVEGMYTHLEDTDRLQFWNGSAWSSPLGLTPIISEPIGSGVTSVVVANVFSSAFDNYKILVDSTGSATDNFRIQLNNSTGSTYLSQGFYMNGSTSTLVGYASTNNHAVIGITTNSSLSASVEVFNPFLAVRTRFFSTSMGNDYFANQGSRDSSTASSTGFILSPATGTLTGGTISVYGYRKG
jgi:hypothetical protein